jgi:hypothetical protein
MVDPITIQDIPDHVLYYEIFSKLVFCEETLKGSGFIHASFTQESVQRT